MELARRMRMPKSRGGFMLVSVIIITAIGLLFGAGALLLFKFQCQLRIDRQHELEKVYAVRSALNYMRTCTADIFEDVNFTFHTGSGRDLGIIVRPVEDVFPVLTNEHHFAMTRQGDLKLDFSVQYDPYLDYEYGVANWDKITIAPTHAAVNNGMTYGLAFSDLAATNNVKWWVNIGMPGTGGWLQEDYGRRYFCWMKEFVNGKQESKDVLRMCIIRNVTNELMAAGRRHGWPLSQEDERALVLQVTPRPGVGEANNAEVMMYEYVHTNNVTTKTALFESCWRDVPENCHIGIQLADDKISAFHVKNDGVNIKGAGTELITRGYEFSMCTNISWGTYEYFSKPQLIGDKWYDGVTNENGKVLAPELRVVFEIEAASDLRKTIEDTAAINQENVDFVTNFRVTPAYQYDIFVVHPETVTNLATVAQKLGRFNRDGIKYTMVAYDTHGTEHKGFRKDEREHIRNLAKRASGGNSDGGGLK